MLKIFLLICFSVCCLSANSQDNKDNIVTLFFEKAYLHTDREAYRQGDNIWYKAYLVNAQTNTHINYSHNLYVELINPQEKIVSREMLRLEDGFGNGDFKLSDTITPGIYRLRAYTNWMRNFGDNFIFEKNIIIQQETGIKNIAATVTPTVQNKNVTIVSPDSPTVHFYPEGGSLVDGISSIVAVKSENNIGKGIPVSGIVLSSSGDTISRFSCDSLGMGMFVLLPVNGQNYHAVIQEPVTNGVSQVSHYAFQLPTALSQGLTLQVKSADSVIHVFVNSSGPLYKNNIINLVIRHGGKTLLKQPLQLQNLQTTIKIPITSLIDGIAAITLYSSGGTPECERLIYIHHSDNRNIITIHTDKEFYQPKEQVNVHIKTFPNSKLSIAAVNAVTVPLQNENILSYLNLQSEIRGIIEQPGRYFDPTNINRYKQLNLLLLTQGWRNFIWHRLEDTTLKLNYDVETGITLTGKVTKQWSKKPLPHVYITAFAPNATAEKLFTTVTDSLGKFEIHGVNFNGYQFINFNAIKGNANDAGRISVDSLYKDTLKIGPNKFRMLSTKAANIDSQLKQGPTKKFTFKENNQLQEVKIKGKTYKLTTIIHHVTAQDQKEYACLGQYLLYMIPGARYAYKFCKGENEIEGMLPTHPYIPGANISVQYTDHSEVIMDCYTDIVMLSMKYVVNVTIRGGAINVLLRAGALDIQHFMNNTTADVTGYYKAREFYRPMKEPLDNMPGPIVNTIHWEPNITTDNNGEATVTFYNTAQPGKVRLVAEGIGQDGTPLAINASYEIK